MCSFKRVENDNSVTVLVFYVNDCFIRASSEAMIDRFIIQWDDKYPRVTQHRRRIVDFVGMMFENTIEVAVMITQKGFIDESNCPHSTELFMVDENSPILDNKK